jgi:RNA polymerase sigma-70 factor (ECF subfamily)
MKRGATGSGSPRTVRGIAMAAQAYFACRRTLSLRIADFHSTLLRRARGLVGHSEAEDLVQDTIERALRSSWRFETGSNLLAWLWRIMANLWVDGLRREKVRSRSFVEVDSQRDPAPDEPEAWENLTAEDVFSALECLSPPLREVFELRHHRQASYGEIAHQLSIPTSTVCTRLWRARRRLRRALISGHAQAALQARGDGKSAVVG